MYQKGTNIVFVTDTDKWRILRFRNFNDFRWGSFDVYVLENELIIRGRLKKGNTSPYMTIYTKGG